MFTDRRDFSPDPAPLIWSVILIGLSLSAVPSWLGREVPAWFQPTLIGVWWGGLFLLGMGVAAAARAGALGMTAGIVCGWWLTVAQSRVMDLGLAECSIASLLLVAAGWMVIRLDDRAARGQWPGHRSRQSRQWPLLDLFAVTTLIACLLHAARRIDSPPVLLIGVLSTLVVGCVSSWAAYRWAWDDCHPAGRPLVVLSVLVIGAVGAVWWWIPSLTAGQLLRWLLEGPISVLAAQTFLVLMAMAVARRGWQLPGPVSGH